MFCEVSGLKQLFLKILWLFIYKNTFILTAVHPYQTYLLILIENENNVGELNLYINININMIEILKISIQYDKLSSPHCVVQWGTGIIYIL